MKIALLSPITRSVRLGFVVLALIGPTVRFSFGQSSPDLKSILEGVSKVYENPLRYEVVETITMELGAVNGKGVHKSNIRIAAQDPNRFRLESEESDEIDGLPSDPGQGPMVIIGDGANVWEISPAENQYTKVKPSDLRTVRTWVKGAESGVFDIPVMLRKEAEDVTLLREEPLALDGSSIDCFVITLALPNHPESTTLWVEKKRLLVRRIRSEQEPSMDTHGLGASITTDFPVVNIGGPLPDSTFVFTPSPSAKEVDR